jgi:5-methylcytosine-specific restriction endonuclease McrA
MPWPGCAELPYRPPIHQPIVWRPQGAARARPAVEPYYHSKEWKALRQATLQRCRYRCELNLIGCTGRATLADHILPRAQGGLDTLFNLRGVCKSCHNKRHPEKGGAH